MLILNILGTQIARYFLVPFVTVFLNWCLRLICTNRSIIYYYNCDEPLISIDLAVSSILLVVLDSSFYLSTHDRIASDYAANILWALITSLVILFTIVLILKKGCHGREHKHRRFIAAILGIISIIISYLFMKV